MADETSFMTAVADPATLLLTTSLTQDGLEAQVPLLTRALPARAASSDTETLFVVACENTIGPNYAGLASHNLVGVQFVTAVVDRMCEPPVIADDGSIQVWGERYGRWSFCRTDGIEGLEAAFAGNAHVEFVDDLVATQKRKLYMMNGPHLVAALHAWDQGEAWLHAFVLTGLGEGLVRGALEEASWALANQFPDAFQEGELSDYADEIAQRLATHPYETVSVLRNRLRADALQSFVTGLTEKIVNPALRYSKVSPVRPPC